MNTTRKYLRDTSALMLLTLAVILRSLIAPGLIVENSSGNPSGLHLAYCDDLIPVQIPGVSSNDAHHHLDPGHVYDVPENTGDSDTHGSGGHDHSLGYGLSSGGHCGLWTASGIFLAGISWQISRLFEIQGAERLRPQYDEPHPRTAPSSRAQPRAPPWS